MRVRFWGVRGSIACAGAAWSRYGGNTSCVEVRCGDRPVILDAGTGLRRLGVALQGAVDVDLLLTHTHVDHIEGIPFFRPLFNPASRVRIHAGHLPDWHPLEEVLAGYMAPPLFPVPPSIFTAKVSYHVFELDRAEVPNLGPDIGVVAARLNHPNGATGYRITYGGRSVCYVTDTEHTLGKPDPNVVELVRGADLMIYDATFTDEEFPRFVGWGHSTWQEGVRLCDEAGVKRLIVFHHDPNHDDAFMDQVAAEVERARPGSIVAREGMEVHLPPGDAIDIRIDPS